MADVDSKLAASLRQAKTNPMFFVFVAKGTEGKLLVDKKKISPKDASDAKKQCGGGTVYTGRCKGEEGKIVFEMGKEAPGTLATVTKKIIRQDAGLTLDVEYRIAADLAAEENQVETDTPTTPANGAASWEKALAAIEPAYLQGVRDRPEKASMLQAVMGFAKSKAEKGDFTGAIGALQKLTQELESLPKSTAAKPTTPNNDPRLASFKKKLDEWTPDIKAAMAAKGPSAAEIARLLTQAVALSKPGSDIDQALAALTKCRDLAIAAPASADPAAEWERRVTALEPRVLEAKRTRPDEAKWMTLFMSAQDLGGDGEFAKSSVILDKLEDLLNAPKVTGDSARDGKAPGRKGPTLVQLQESRLSWEATLKTVRAERDKLIQAILGEFTEEEDKDIAREATDVIRSALDEFNEKLLDTLDRALNAEKPEDRDSQNAAAAQVVKNYLDHLNTEPIFGDLDVNPFTSVNLHASLSKSLTDLASVLV